VKRLLLIPLLFAVGLAQAQNTITFTAETTTGTGVVTPVLTWSTAPPADDCGATGDWSGLKGPSGTETLPDITSGATYNLTCNWLDDKATLTWTAPTENTDGSPYTDPDGYRLFRGVAPGGPYDDGPVSGIVIASPATVTYVDQPLLPGQYCYVATAINQVGIQSDLSGEACKDVDSSSDVQSVGIVVNPQPSPVSGLTIQ